MKHTYNTLSLLSVAAIALVLVGVGCSPTSGEIKDTDDMMMEDTMQPETMEESQENMENTMMEGEHMMEKDDSMMMEQSSAGSFEAYSADKLSRANDGTVVLAFLADWCPTCRAFKSDTLASLGDIPAGLNILDINYDNAQDLRKKYGVTTQHTFVQVDADGTLIQKWSGGNTLETVVEKVS